MLTGNLQIKNDTYYAVINYKQGEKYKQKWISTKLKTTGNKRRATEFLNSVIEKYSEMDLKKKMWNIKFTDYAQKWLENKKGTVEQCTWDGYFNSVEKHIIPYFEKLNLYIKDIKPMHISEYYNYKFRNGRCDNKGGLSMCSLKAQRFVLKCILNNALSVDEIITKNPALNVPLPKIEKSKEQHSVFLNQEQANEMLKCFDNHPLQPLVYISLCYGLRRSEVLGLKWKAVNFEDNTLKIEHTVVKGLTIEKKDRTKSASSKATYKITPKVKEVFEDLKIKQEENKKLFGNDYIESDYIFTWKDGKLFRPDYVTKGFQKVLKKSGFSHMRFHDLRHSCASILHDKGYSLKKIQEWLRHSDIETTGNIYVHILKSRQVIENDNVDEIFSL